MGRFDRPTLRNSHSNGCMNREQANLSLPRTRPSQPEGDSDSCGVDLGLLAQGCEEVRGLTPKVHEDSVNVAEFCPRRTVSKARVPPVNELIVRSNPPRMARTRRLIFVLLGDTLMGMSQRFGSFLMLFVIGTCSVLCRASLAATRSAVDAANRGTIDSCCDSPGEERKPSAPEDLCKSITCFCSPFVMHETSSNLTVLLALTTLPAPATCEHHARFCCSAMQNGSWEGHISPACTAEHSAALPLLI